MAMFCQPTKPEKYRSVKIRPVRYKRHDERHEIVEPTNSKNRGNDLFDDFDCFYVQDENVLPAAPYPEECYFAPTTFLSAGRTLTPSKLRNAIETFLQNAPLVGLCVQKKNPWVLYYEFFHFGIKNEFMISFFEASDAKNKQSCLVEMHKSSGDHAPFQKLAEAIRQQFNLTYAFGSVTSSTTESTPKPFDDFSNCFGVRATTNRSGLPGPPTSFEPSFDLTASDLDTILIHLQSPFRDVQVQGLAALPHVTGTAVAEALLETKIDDRNALKEILAIPMSTIQIPIQVS